MSTRVLENENVHCTWSADHEAILEVEQEEIIRVLTRDGFNSQLDSPLTAEMVEERLPEVLDFSRIAPLTGPIHVRGAQPGDTLKVEILDVIPIGEGNVLVTPAWFQSDFLAQEYRKSFPGAYLKHFDMAQAVEKGYLQLTQKVKIPLDPMIGMIGTAPSHGRFTTSAPREYGGNLDARIIKKNSIVYLPVFVHGAKLSLGDVHAAQGDGELCTTAVECPADITIKISIEKEYSFSLPFVETKDCFISLGHGRDLDTAAKLAAQSMIDFLSTYKHMTKMEAYVALSLCGNLVINQVVNPNLGVRMEVPKSIFQK